MNSGATMERVYAALKADIMNGRFAPGDRLDPARLADGLAASATPVRDSLHRLSGERLIDSWQGEGFRLPIVTEPALRDIYRWNAEVLTLALREIGRTSESIGLSEPQATDAGQSVVEVTAHLFADIAALSLNHEHRAAITNLNDRLHAIRIAEAGIIADALEEIGVIESQLRSSAWPQLRQSIGAYHRRRVVQIPELVGMLRPRAPV